MTACAEDADGTRVDRYEAAASRGLGAVCPLCRNRENHHQGSEGAKLGIIMPAARYAEKTTNPLTHLFQGVVVGGRY